MATYIYRGKKMEKFETLKWGVRRAGLPFLPLFPLQTRGLPAF